MLHQCLSDGTFDPGAGECPLNQCFLGAKLLSKDPIVNFVAPEVVADVAPALAALDRHWLVRRYSAVYGAEYPTGIPDEDFQLYHEMLADLSAGYWLAAGSRWAVVFCTDEGLANFFHGDGRVPDS